MSQITEKLLAASALSLLAWINCWVVQLPLPTYKCFSENEIQLAYLSYCEKMLEYKPNDWKLSFYLGRAHEGLTNFECALDAYNRALSLHPRNVQILQRRARLESIIGDLDDSVSDYGLILDLIGPSSKYLADRSTVFSHLHKYIEAKSDAELAVRLAPRNAGAHLALSFADLGLDRLSEAISECHIAERFSPATMPILLCKAEISIAKKDWQKAVMYCDLALKKHPSAARYLWLRALAYKELGLYNMSLNSSRMAIGYNPMVAAPYIIRAQVDYKLKKYTEAKFNAEEAIKLSQDVHNVSDVYHLNSKSITQENFTKSNYSRQKSIK